MVENRPWVTFLSHAVLIAGVVVVAFPLYVTFVASTLTLDQIVQVPMPLLPGDHLIENYSQVLTAGSTKGSSAAVSTMLMNSLIMALTIAIGKIAISVIASFAIVYFRFPLRHFFFWMIFVTLMLPRWPARRSAAGRRRARRRSAGRSPWWAGRRCAPCRSS